LLGIIATFYDGTGQYGKRTRAQALSDGFVNFIKVVEKESAQVAAAAPGYFSNVIGSIKEATHTRYNSAPMEERPSTSTASGRIRGGLAQLFKSSNNDVP
jgi:hypothetical protein